MKSHIFTASIPVQVIRIEVNEYEAPAILSALKYVLTFADDSEKQYIEHLLEPFELLAQVQPAARQADVQLAVPASFLPINITPDDGPASQIAEAVESAVVRPAAPRWTCERCGRVAKNAAGLASHMRSCVMPDPKAGEAAPASDHTETRASESATRTRESEPAPTLAGMPEHLYPCRCGRNWASQERLEHHIERDHGGVEPDGPEPAAETAPPAEPKESPWRAYPVDLDNLRGVRL